jgi:hypothetical protein
VLPPDDLENSFASYDLILQIKEAGMHSAHKIVLALFVLLLLSCRTKQDGTIEGIIVAPGTSARVSAMQDDKNILTVTAAGQDGKFKLALAAGTYTISVTVPDSPYPLKLNNIVVKSRETTILPPIELTPSAGKASLSGKVIPARPGSEVKLLYEGKERAAVQTDREGKYEFKELPAGTYVVQAQSPGYAGDSAQVVITGNQKVEQTAVLFPIVSINGVDWAAGKIRSTGIGIPPQNSANDSVRRAMAQRAALADAQRNMLRTIEQIRISDGQDVKDAMRSKNIASKIQGFLKGYTVVSERELEGGRIEVVLELPLTGPAGLSRFIVE